jgi:hypothetical protein
LLASILHLLLRLLITSFLLVISPWVPDWWVKPSEYGGNRSVVITTIDPSFGGVKGESAVWACSMLVAWTMMCFVLVLLPRGDAHYRSRKDMEPQEDAADDEQNVLAKAYVASTHGPQVVPTETGKKKRKSKRNSEAPPEFTDE